MKACGRRSTKIFETRFDGELLYTVSSEKETIRVLRNLKSKTKYNENKNSRQQVKGLVAGLELDPPGRPDPTPNSGSTHHLRSHYNRS